MEETLFEWGERLKKLGFSLEYYQSICGDLYYIDWYKEDEHIRVEVRPTKEYSKYLESLEIGVEYSPDWTQYMVVSVTIDTSEFAYPEGRWYNNKFEGNICLSNRSLYKNFTSLNVSNFEKALWMSRHPIQAKSDLVLQFIKEVNKLFEIHGKTFEKYHLKQQESDLLLVGIELCSSEPNISFKHPKIFCDEFGLHYNMWTGKLVYTKYVESEIDGIYGTNYAINVNEISSEELEQYIKSFLNEYLIYDDSE